MLYEEAKRQTYEGLTAEEFQWLSHVYLDYGYLNQSLFWEAFRALLEQLGIDAFKLFELRRVFCAFLKSLDNYFFYYGELGLTFRNLKFFKDKAFEGGNKNFIKEEGR